jgi:hypothetical protein
MGGVSIWQLVILLLIFGGPIAMYFVISSGPKDDIRRPLKFFHGSFWIAVVGTVVFFVVGAAVDDFDTVAAELGLLALVLIVAGWSYLVALGVLASRTGRSWILWAGLTLLTSPLGTIVSYLMMSSRAKSSKA